MLTSTRTITLTPGPGYVFDTGDFLAFAREVTATANSVQVRLSLDEHGDPDGLEAIVEEGTHEQP